MTSRDGEQLFGAGVVRAEACDSKDGFIFDVTGFDMFSGALDANYLAAMGEENIVVNVGTGPDAANFQAAVALVDCLVLRGEKFYQGLKRRYLP